MAKPTDINQYHLDAAGLVMRDMRTLPAPLDAQITLALACTYLCGQYEIHPGTFCKVLLHNINEIANDPQLHNRTVERIHTISTAKSGGGGAIQIAGAVPP